MAEGQPSRTSLKPPYRDHCSTGSWALPILEPRKTTAKSRQYIDRLGSRLCPQPRGPHSDSPGQEARLGICRGKFCLTHTQLAELQEKLHPQGQKLTREPQGSSCPAHRRAGHIPSLQGIHRLGLCLWVAVMIVCSWTWGWTGGKLWFKKKKMCLPILRVDKQVWSQVQVNKTKFNLTIMKIGFLFCVNYQTSIGGTARNRTWLLKSETETSSFTDSQSKVHLRIIVFLHRVNGFN